MKSQVVREAAPSWSLQEGPWQSDAWFAALLGRPMEGGQALVAAIRKGFPVSVVDRLARELGLSQQELLRLLGLSSATFTRRRTARKPLTPQESDRIYRIAAAWLAALRLFEGDRESARRWLVRPARALGGDTPLQHLDTEAGALELHDLIGRLESGVVS